MLGTMTRCKLGAGSLFLRLLIVALLSSAPAAVSAQGFSVNPMRVEASVPPDRTAAIQFEVTNDLPAVRQEIELELVHLSQFPDGRWRYRPMASGEGSGSRHPDSSWISLQVDRVQIEPGESELVEVLVRPPVRARGSIVGGLLVRGVQSSTRIGDVGVHFQYLIPVIVNVEGRYGRQSISLTDLSLQRIEISNQNSGVGGGLTTLLHLHVSNTGETYPRISGRVQVYRLQGEIWRRVTTVDLNERGIIPGSNLELRLELERDLPPGSYRLIGTIWASGRRLPRITREVSVDGDAKPGMYSVAFDARWSSLQQKSRATFRQEGPGAASSRSSTRAVMNSVSS